MKCSQCNKQAIVQFDFGALCVDCYLKFMQAQDIRNASLERQINHLKDVMDYTMGVKTYDRFPERKPPVIQTAPVTMNSINIDKSVVGSVNTGYVKQLEVSMNTVVKGAEEIKSFAEGVLKNKELKASQKEELLRQLDYLTQQLRLPPKNRNVAVMKAVGNTMVEIINFSASLVALWGPVKTLLGL